MALTKTIWGKQSRPAVFPVRGYLDDNIRHWRAEREKALADQNDRDLLIAECYVDAYQSVRVSLFGDLLP